MTHQNIVFLVSEQLPLAGTSPPMLVTVVLNRPLIRSIEIGTSPLFMDPRCKNEISVGVTTKLLAGDPFPSDAGKAHNTRISAVLRVLSTFERTSTLQSYFQLPVRTLSQ